MIKIKYIKAQNFRLYRDIELDFTGKKGVYSLIAKNNDMFDSNSSGKSTLPMFIESVLYGQNSEGIAVGSLKTKHTFQKPILEIHYDIGNTSYIWISNYDSPTESKLFENGVELPIKKKTDKSQYVKDKLGIDFNIFNSILLLSPESKLFFMESDPKKQADLIMELLNLQFISGYFKESKAQITALSKEYDSYHKVVKNLKDSIETLNMQIEAIPRQQVRDISKKVAQLEKEIESLDIEPVSKLLGQVKRDKTGKDTKYNKAVISLTHAEKALNKVKPLKKELKCPTCLQEIDEGHYNDLYNEAREDYDEALENKKSTYEELVSLRAEQDKLQAELDALTSEKVTKEYELKRLKESQKEDNAQAERNAMREKLEDERNKKTLELTENKLAMDSLADDIYVYELIKKCAGPKGFVSERIKLFNQLYNKYLTDLSSSLLEGKMKARIDEVKERQFAIVVDDGEYEFTYQELSSGLKARIKIISQIALVEVVEALTGIGLNLMFLDEILGTADEAAIYELEELFDKLRTRFPDKLFIIVSHEKTLRNIDGSLLVERTNNESTLKWID